MRRAILLTGIATASAFICPGPILPGITSLKMAKQPRPAEKPNFVSPKAKDNALAQNKKQRGIVSEAEGVTLIASSAADERTRLGATPKVSWKERTDFRSNEKWPANVLNDKTPGVFNGGGWATTKATDTEALVQMKGSALMISLGILLFQPFTYMDTYQMNTLGYIVKGEPISVGRAKEDGEPVLCRKTYGVPCWPHGGQNEMWRPM